MFQLIALVLFACGAYGVELVVQTQLGEVRGLKSDEGNYTMFLGVPYALVDEDNRFGAPIPHPGYNEPISAYSDETTCPQSMGTSFSGSLQCLLLNIYVPDVPDDIENSPLPVLVWIHGGAWVMGSGGRHSSSPNFLVRHGIIIVTIQYRIGMYGFLCTDSPKAPGNAGLKDQLEAFRWIKNHISAFGGDPNKVTIFGESAGGMSLHLHIQSHNEKLFERAIIQSGASSSPWAYVEQQNELPIQVANGLGFVTDNLEDAMGFLATANVSDVVVTANVLGLVTAANNIQPLTKACVEKEFEGIERIVAIHPNIAKSDKVKDMDIMIGYNSEEMIFQYAAKNNEFYDNFSFLQALEFGFNTTDMAEMEILLKHFYIGDEETSIDVEHDIIRFGSDFVWINPTERAIEQLLKDEARVIYQYVFSYEGGRNFLKSNINTMIPGAAHADELGYLFDKGNFKDQVDTAEDLRMIDQITTLWTNFAKYGNPTPETTDLLPVIWEPVTSTTKPYLNLDREVTLERRPFHDRVAFWDLVYEKYRNRAKGFSDL